MKNKEFKVDAFKKPFRYDFDEQRIFDSDGRELLQIRGWSFLSRHFTHAEGVAIQDKYGVLIANHLNEKEL